MSAATICLSYIITRHVDNHSTYSLRRSTEIHQYHQDKLTAINQTEVVRMVLIRQFEVYLSLTVVSGHITMFACHYKEDWLLLCLANGNLPELTVYSELVKVKSFRYYDLWACVVSSSLPSIDTSIWR